MSDFSVFIDNHQNKTLCYLIRINEKGETEYLFCMHRKQQKWNGVGGKVGDKEEFKDETIEEGAIREIKEELGVKATHLISKGMIDFKVDGKHSVFCHIFFVDKWEGEIRGIEVDTPTWFTHQNLPTDKMWENDPFWFAKVVKAKGKVSGEYHLFNDEPVEEIFFKEVD